MKGQEKITVISQSNAHIAPWVSQGPLRKLFEIIKKHVFETGPHFLLLLERPRLEK